jgi:hypothetical protein
MARSYVNEMNFRSGSKAVLHEASSRIKVLVRFSLDSRHEVSGLGTGS